jgi:hypothetical protein
MSADSFSKRLREDPRFAVPAHQKEHGELRYLAVSDQLLVDHRLLEHSNGEPTQFALALTQDAEENGWEPTTLTSLFADLSGPTDGDVDIVHVRGVDDIFALVDRLRTLLPMDEDHGALSPNHVLIPAPVDGHGCPWGPPRPADGDPTLPAPATPEVNVTVIDSGYQWDDNNWSPNPLTGFLSGPPEPAMRPPTWAEVAHAKLNGQPPPSWIVEQMDVPGETVGTAPLGRLVALAGHANFIAGVIAQDCPRARIRIINHNGAFRPKADDYPTEASVAHSLASSAGAHVVNLGFAFTAYNGRISTVWNKASDYLARHSNPVPIVVAPAGNQDATEPRYPAALENVVGVAALNHKGGRAKFSNHDGGASGEPDWVTCSALGQNIRSTFLDVEMLLEDGNIQTQDFTSNSWALWNGTSFAAPKVVAAIACRVDAANDPAAAWQAVQDSNEEWSVQNGVRSNDPPHIGVVLRSLGL